MSDHNPQNSQCDLSMYGPDPGDGSVKCTCDEDAPVLPATGPARQGPQLVRPRTPQELAQFSEVAGQLYGSSRTLPPEPGAVTLTGRAALSHTELRSAGQELRAARDLYVKAEARWKAALDAHMQEIQ